MDIVKIVLKRIQCDETSGLKTETMEVVTDWESMRAALCRGGRGYSGYDVTMFAGVCYEPEPKSMPVAGREP